MFEFYLDFITQEEGNEGEVYQSSFKMGTPDYDGKKKIVSYMMADGW